jgi:sulfatase maturation enzyme AslB (radical SAM superfamily)
MAGAKESGLHMPANMERVDFTRFKEPSSIRNVALMLTTRCPLSCRYCFLNRGQLDMPEGVLKKSIDLLFTSLEEKIELQFFGGEPLARFDLIKKAVAYAGMKKKATGKNIEYLLTTNGLLLDEEKAGFLSREKVQVMVSIDGARVTQLKNRPVKAGNEDYFSQLLRNIGLLNKHKVQYFVNMVVLREDIPEMRKNTDFLRSKGMLRIWVAYALGQKYSEKDSFAFIKELCGLFKAAQGTGVRILNFEADCEPILYCPQINITARGKIFIGCALVLENLYPELNRIFYFGKLDDFKELAALKMTKGAQAALIRRRARLLDQKLLVNIYAGIAGEFLYKFNHLRREYDLFENHPIKKRIRAERYFSFRKISFFLHPERPYSCAGAEALMRAGALRKSIDMLFASLEHKVELEISCKEPLACFEMIRAALLYIRQRMESHPKQLTCTLVSPGLSLDEEKIDFLSRQKVPYLLKIDGAAPPAHLKRQVSGIIKCFSGRGGDFGVMLDVPLLNLDGFEENVSFLTGRGVKKIMFSYDPAVLYDAPCVARAFVRLFKISRGLYFHKAVQILNCGPAGACGAWFPGITVDLEGRMYLCGSLISSKRFQYLKKTAYIGDIAAPGHRKAFTAGLDAALCRLMSSHKSGSWEKEVVMNNFIIEEMFWEFFHSQMYFPLKRQVSGDARCLI